MSVLVVKVLCVNVQLQYGTRVQFGAAESRDSGPSAGLGYSDSVQLQSNRDAGVSVAQSIASQESTGEALLVAAVLL